MPDKFSAEEYNDLGITALIEGNFEVALQYFNKALELKPFLAGVLYNRGNLYKILGNSTKAISDYNLAIELEPRYYEAYVHRGIVYLELLQDAHTAITDFTLAIEIDPNRVQAHFNRANAYSFLDNYSAAIRDVSQAIEIAPDNKGAYLNRGYLYFRIRNYRAALTDFTQAIKLDADFTEAYLNRGDTYKALLNLDAALNDYAAVIEIDTSDIKSIATAHTKRGEILEEQSNSSAAFYEYDRALLLAPDVHYLHHKRAAILLNLEQYTAALESYNRAIASDDGCVHCFWSRAFVNFELGNYAESIADTTQILLHDPFNAHALYIRAYSRLKTGENRLIVVQDLELAHQIFAAKGNKSGVEQVEHLYVPAPETRQTKATRKAELYFPVAQQIQAIATFVQNSSSLSLNTICENVWEISTIDHESKEPLVGRLIFDPDHGWFCPSWVRQLLKSALALILFNNKGIEQAQQRNFTQSIKIFNLGLVLQPNYPNLLANRALSKYNSLDLAGAIADYDKAIEHHPDSAAEAWFGRGRILFQKGDWAGAKRDFQHAHAINPDLPGLEAERLHLTRLTWEDKQAMLLYQQAEPLADAEDEVSWKEALTLLRRTFKLSSNFPNIADAYCLYAKVQSLLNKDGAAEKYALMALERKPDHYQAMICLGRALLIKARKRKNLSIHTAATTQLYQALELARQAQDKSALKIISYLLNSATLR